MSKKLTDSRRANLGASAIHEAFKQYRNEFIKITQRAKIRFKNRDWHGMRSDAADRLGLYNHVIDKIEADISILFSFTRAYFHVENACIDYQGNRS
jgi:isocitrate dehydrogenase kinase/phosphatase